MFEVSDAAKASFARLNLLGESSVFLATLRMIEKFAAVDAPVLVLGETGTGKELAARALHYLNKRREFAFVPVNCGALPDTLLESELFGHERGAFTDAKRVHRGLVAEAAGGTLFLDEVEAMTPRAQVVLLRFLQNHEYRPVGGGAVKRSDVRVIAASNVDLADLARRNLFRSDLLFRFGVLNITMPPLRRRGEDVVLLARHFLDVHAAQYRRPRLRLHASALERLRSESWPGNVRELENFVLREFLLADSGTSELRLDAPLAETELPDASDLVFKSAKARAVADFERKYLNALLSRTCGNISLAARLSCTDRGALNRLVRKYGLAGEQFRNSPV